MSTIPPPTPEEIHAWGWEMGLEAGRRLADDRARHVVPDGVARAHARLLS